MDTYIESRKRLRTAHMSRCRTRILADLLDPASALFVIDDTWFCRTPYTGREYPCSTVHLARKAHASSADRQWYWDAKPAPAYDFQWALH